MTWQMQTFRSGSCRRSWSWDSHMQQPRQYRLGLSPKLWPNPLMDATLRWYKMSAGWTTWWMTSYTETYHNLRKDQRYETWSGRTDCYRQLELTATNKGVIWFKDREDCKLKKIKTRKALVWKAAHDMKDIWKGQMPKTLNLSFFHWATKIIPPHGCKAWTPTKAMIKSLDGCYTRMLRIVQNVGTEWARFNERLYDLDLPNDLEMINSRISRLCRTLLPPPRASIASSSGSRNMDEETLIDQPSSHWRRLSEDARVETEREPASLMLDSRLCCVSDTMSFSRFTRLRRCISSSSSSSSSSACETF